MDENTSAKYVPGIVAVKTCPDKPPTKAAGANDKGKEAARTKDNNDNDEDKAEKNIVGYIACCQEQRAAGARRHAQARTI